MNDRMHQLALRIDDELKDLDRVVGRIHEGWRKAQFSDDDYYLDSVALNLHGFYAGLERIFELIAVAVDGNKPDGENWHQALLFQMKAEKSDVRPAVISDPICSGLDAYRGFRHVVRNVYAFKFDPAKISTSLKAVQAPHSNGFTIGVGATVSVPTCFLPGKSGAREPRPYG